LNLDPLQKFVNQVKLSDVLEEVNIQAVNEIGIDLNLVVDHDHMHSMLQFVSGLGPRKSKNLIDRIKQLGSKLITRS
jgi:transcription elongation factor SPT6